MPETYWVNDQGEYLIDESGNYYFDDHCCCDGPVFNDCTCCTGGITGYLFEIRNVGIIGTDCDGCTEWNRQYCTPFEDPPVGPPGICASGELLVEDLIDPCPAEGGPVDVAVRWEITLDEDVTPPQCAFTWFLTEDPGGTETLGIHTWEEGTITCDSLVGFIESGFQDFVSRCVWGDDEPVAEIEIIDIC